VLFFLNQDDFYGSNPHTDKDGLLFLGRALVPALAAALLCFSRIFWIIAVLGMWFLLIAFGLPTAWSAFLVFGALVMVLTPFVAWVWRRNARGVADNKWATW
jgi:hypothetical protein